MECSVCGSAAKLQCARCQKQRYCGRSCAAADAAEHSYVCRRPASSVELEDYEAVQDVLRRCAYPEGHDEPTELRTDADALLENVRSDLERPRTDIAVPGPGERAGAAEEAVIEDLVGPLGDPDDP